MSLFPLAKPGAELKQVTLSHKDICLQERVWFTEPRYVMEFAIGTYALGTCLQQQTCAC